MSDSQLLQPVKDTKMLVMCDPRLSNMAWLAPLYAPCLLASCDEPLQYMHVPLLSHSRLKVCSCHGYMMPRMRTSRISRQETVKSYPHGLLPRPSDQIFLSSSSEDRPDADTARYRPHNPNPSVLVGTISSQANREDKADR